MSSDEEEKIEELNGLEKTTTNTPSAPTTTTYPPPGDVNDVVVEDLQEDETRVEPRIPKKHPSMLPVITPELLHEHESQKKILNESFGRTNDRSTRRRNSNNNNNSTNNNNGVVVERGEETICGVPYYLFMILAALLAAVIAGTVFAVIYHNPNEGIQPPSPSPSSLRPTSLPLGERRTTRRRTRGIVVR